MDIIFSGNLSITYKKETFFRLLHIINKRKRIFIYFLSVCLVLRSVIVDHTDLLILSSVTAHILFHPVDPWSSSR